MPSEASADLRERSRATTSIGTAVSSNLLCSPTREVEQAAENALADGAEAVVLVLIRHSGARASDRLGSLN